MQNHRPVAYVTVGHHAVLKAVEHLMQTKKLDLARLERKSRGGGTRSRPTGCAANLDRYFPFLREPLRAGVESGKKPAEAFWEAIDGFPAVHLGTTFGDLPALLPLAERRKHLYAVGKTRTGATDYVAWLNDTPPRSTSTRSRCGFTRSRHHWGTGRRPAAPPLPCLVSSSRNACSTSKRGWRRCRARMSGVTAPS